MLVEQRKMSRVVEIESSPEPETSRKFDSNIGDIPTGPTLLTRKRGTMSATVSAAAGPGPSTVAARARSTRQAVKNSPSGPIIELTDSDSDDAGFPAFRRARSVSRHTSLTKSFSQVKLPASVARAPGTGGIDGAVDAGKEKEKTLPLFMETNEVFGGLGQTSQPPAPPTVARLEGSQGRVNVEPMQSRGEAPIPEEDQAVHVSAGANERQAAPDTPVPQQEQQSNLGEPESEESVLSGYMALVLEIVPDVAPDYLLALIIQLYPQHKNETVGLAIQMLFEDGQYPKVERKGKRKSEGNLDIRAIKKARIEYVDYSQKNRPNPAGPYYTNLSLEHLQTTFPYIPKTFIRKVFVQHNNLYSPTHIYLTDLYKRCNHAPKERPVLRDTDYPFFPRKTPYRPQPLTILKDAEFDKERQWILAYDEEDGDLVKVRARLSVVDDDAPGNDIDPKGKGKAKVTDQEEDEDEDEDQCLEGEGIECNCCFTEYPFERMIQCPEGHLFCKSCVVAYASNQLGLQDIKLKCMDQSGCSLLYPESELCRVLPEKLIALYDRLKQQKEIEEADIEGLEECPFCDYKCVMEMDKTLEKLFRCRNYDGGCGAVSCRECKRPDHLPKACQEMDEDRILDKQHTIEEAMSAALMRTCPKCQKPFIKESGCNKITCYTCQTVSCYVCRKIINGYDHFDRTPGAPRTASGSSERCPLWDAVETRHAREVKVAAEKAMKDMKSQDPDIDTSAMKVDVPGVKPPSKSKHPHPLPAIAPPVPPALYPPGYGPGPARPGHNPIERYPPQVAAPPQFPQIAAPAGLPANPHVNVQWEPVLVPPAPFVPAGRGGRANRYRNRNPQAQNQPKGRRARR